MSEEFEVDDDLHPIDDDGSLPEGVSVCPTCSTLVETEQLEERVRPQTWDVLGEVVDSITYVDRSRFALSRDDGANFAVLMIFITSPNSYREDRADRYTRHEFVVPVATYDRENWIRWVFEQLKSIEIHEVCEWFKVDGQRAYPPHHGNGEIPYVEWHMGTAERAAKAPGDA